MEVSELLDPGSVVWILAGNPGRSFDHRLKAIKVGLPRPPSACVQQRPRRACPLAVRRWNGPVQIPFDLQCAAEVNTEVHIVFTLVHSSMTPWDSVCSCRGQPLLRSKPRVSELLCVYTSAAAYGWFDSASQGARPPDLLALLALVHTGHRPLANTGNASIAQAARLTPPLPGAQPAYRSEHLVTSRGTL